MSENDSEARADILIVDDTPANLQLLTEILSYENYKVRAVTSGQMALQAAQSKPPDLILLDIMMPGMDGFETCRQLKADERTRAIPVIFLSALTETGDKVKAFSIGGVDYIIKPFHMDEVMARVETHLTIHRLQQSLRERNLRLEQEITERKRVEAELQAQNAELDAFAHTVAHDLKNPLTGVIGSTELLRKYYKIMTDEDRAERVDAIERSGRKMFNIINALLLLASTRRMSDVPIDLVHMNAVIESVLARLQPMIEESHAHISYPKNWPETLGYEPWVEEVWVNYLSNALKYGGKQPQVELGFDPPAEGDSRVRLWVKDNGPGLSLEQREQLFMPFTRLSQAKIEGHGLGLSIVQRIITKLDGEVGVESQPGNGSKFYFTLSLAE